MWLIWSSVISKVLHFLFKLNFGGCIGFVVRALTPAFAFAVMALGLESALEPAPAFALDALNCVRRHHPPIQFSLAARQNPNSAAQMTYKVFKHQSHTTNPAGVQAVARV
jgi:hypothetical protein